MPLVIVGSTPTDVYEKATKHDRVYYPIPESCHRYQIRMLDDGSGTEVDPTLLGKAAEPTIENDPHRHP